MCVCVCVFGREGVTLLVSFMIFILALKRAFLSSYRSSGKSVFLIHLLFQQQLFDEPTYSIRIVFPPYVLLYGYKCVYAFNA